MNALPVELLEMIASNFEDTDFFNIRLVNRNLRLQLLQYFSRRYFHIRRHMLSRQSLENLQQVTTHSVFRQSLRQLVLTPYLLSDHHLANLQRSESIIVNEDRYKELLAEQLNLIQSGFYAESLAISLSNARDCKIIAIQDDWYHQTVGLDWLKKQISIDPAPAWQKDTNRNSNVLSQYIHVVFAAVTISHTTLQQLSILSMRLPPNPSMLQIPYEVGNNRTIFSALRTLELSIGPPTESDATTWAIDLGRFIMHFDCLEDLSLAFDSDLEAKYLKDLHENIQLEKIDALEISGVRGGEGELAPILFSHRATLQKVILDNIELPSLESWRLFLKMMRDHLSLKYLELSDCYVGHSYGLILRECPPIGNNSGRTIIARGEEIMSDFSESLDLKPL